MTRDLEMALRVCENMPAAAVDAVVQLISDLGAIKRQIEDRAESRGYSERCREAIAVCGGECCRWHFPKTIDRVDFLIAVFNLSADEKAVLVKQVQSAEDSVDGCPLLRKDGCVFTLETRPVVCTSAFPCLAGTAYWQYKETFREDIDAIRAALDSLIGTHLSD
ncbi:MAG: hypothetical protein GY697_08750 [Desulfobacterales bacterium]|nr:hypothetical protein [Desulfobacterales bacterium]